MPIYEFECRKCKAHLEVFQKLNDKPPVKCRKCGGRLDKMVSASAIQFKGTGWYVTDYAGKGNQGKGSDESKSAEKSEAAGKSESAATSSSDISDKKETSPAKKTSEKASATKTAKSD